MIKTANQTSAVQSVRAIGSAETQYRLGVPGQWLQLRHRGARRRPRLRRSVSHAGTGTGPWPGHRTEVRLHLCHHQLHQGDREQSGHVHRVRDYGQRPRPRAKPATAASAPMKTRSSSSTRTAAPTAPSPSSSNHSIPHSLPSTSVNGRDLRVPGALCVPAPRAEATLRRCQPTRPCPRAPRQGGRPLQPPGLAPDPLYGALQRHGNEPHRIRHPAAQKARPHALAV